MIVWKIWLQKPLVSSDASWGFFSKSWKICLAFLSRDSLCSAHTRLLIFTSCEGSVLDTTLRSFVVLCCTSRGLLLRLHLMMILCLVLLLASLPREADVTTLCAQSHPSAVSLSVAPHVILVRDVMSMEMLLSITPATQASWRCGAALKL